LGETSLSSSSIGTTEMSNAPMWYARARLLTPSIQVREHVPGLELRVERARTDQSYLQETVRQLEALVAAFPIKGDALG
jgi:hypothetical protein